MSCKRLFAGILSLAIASLMLPHATIAAESGTGPGSNPFADGSTAGAGSATSTYPGAPVEVDVPYVELYRAIDTLGGDASGAFRYCAGTLVHRSRRFVVTSAQCSDAVTASEVFVLVRRQQIEPGLAYKVRRITVHPDWNRETLGNDIAVWELETPVRGMRPARLADGDAATGVELSAMRIGLRQEDSMPRLLDVRVPVVSPAACGDPSSRETVDSICAGPSVGSARSCQGDPGGPLLQMKTPGRPVLVGVTSINAGCLHPDLYGIYARVSRARDFIRQTVSGS